EAGTRGAGPARPAAATAAGTRSAATAARSPGSAATASAAASAAATAATATVTVAAPAATAVAILLLLGRALHVGEVRAGVALGHDLALVDPALHADAPERRLGLEEAVVDVCAQ